jgi:sirohydrochlorin ferrochelatase
MQQLTRLKLNIVSLLVTVSFFAVLMLYGSASHSQAEPEHDMSGMSMEGMSMEGMSHDDHQMTPAMMEELRAKVPLYREYSDQEIMLSMQMMGPNYSTYVSNKNLVGGIGVIGLGHGFGDPGDEQFKDAFTSIGKIFPTAVGYGMAMMTSSHIQSAVDDLVAAGVETIVVIPTAYTEDSKLTRQWKYIFGQYDEAPWLEVPRVNTEAKALIARPLSESPIVASIMLDFALEMSTDPENELVIVVSHGPDDMEDNKRELAILENQADIMRQDGSFSAIKVITLQDDAPRDIRAANVATFRGWVETATEEGKRVLVVSNLITTGSVQKKIRRDLAGLQFQFNTKGLMLHPDFAHWIQDTVRRELAESRKR